MLRYLGGTVCPQLAISCCLPLVFALGLPALNIVISPHARDDIIRWFFICPPCAMSDLSAIRAEFSSQWIETDLAH